VIGWEDYSGGDVFCVEGFFQKDQIEELFFVMVLFYVFPTCNIVNFLINFTFLTAAYFSNSRYSLFMLKVLLNPSQSISHIE